MSKNSEAPVVLVTGGARGIGAGATRVFHSHGWYTIVVDQLAAPYDSLKAATSEYHQLDLTDDAALTQFTDKMRARKLNALVNNAGWNKNGGTSIDEISESDYNYIMKLNTKVPWLLIKAFNSQSRTGALNAMTRALATELGTEGVRVNAVMPGCVETPLNKEILGDENSEVRRFWTSACALNICGQEDHIGHLIYFLADPTQSSFITGQCIAADGGLLCKLTI